MNERFSLPVLAISLTFAVGLTGCATREADSADMTIRGFHTCAAAKPQPLLGKDGTVFTCGIRDGRFHFRFDVVDADVCVATKVKHPLDLAGGDRVEVYFVPDAKMEKGYRCAEIDASGRVLSYSVDEKKKFDWFWKFATLESEAKRTSDGTYGFYDRVRGTFNNGKMGGAFTAGETVVADGDALAWSQGVDLQWGLILVVE